MFRKLSLDKAVNSGDSGRIFDELAKLSDDELKKVTSMFSAYQENVKGIARGIIAARKKRKK